MDEGHFDAGLHLEYCMRGKTRGPTVYDCYAEFWLKCLSKVDSSGHNRPGCFTNSRKGYCYISNSYLALLSHVSSCLLHTEIFPPLSLPLSLSL